MRNISFSLTTEQIRNRTKTVTRRLGWKNLKTGTLLQGCVKCMGLKRGEHPEKLAIIRVVSVYTEPLNSLTVNLKYGMNEMILEGFSNMQQPEEFVRMFRDHMNCRADQEVTRIEFKYVD